MANIKNEHVSPGKDGWAVRREGSRRISKLFDRRKDAMDYASIIALNDGGSVVSHKYNGQFKKFKHGNEIHVMTHRVAPIITGTVEIRHPIANNAEPIIESIQRIA